MATENRVPGRSRHPPSVPPALGLGFLAGTLAHIVQVVTWMIFTDDHVSMALFGLNLATCLGVYAALGAAFRGSPPALDLAFLSVPALVALVPLAHAYWRLGSYSRIAGLVLGVGAVLAGLWRRSRAAEARPLAAAAVGAGLGALLGWFRLHWQGSRTDPWLVAATAAAFLVGFALLHLARRRDLRAAPAITIPLALLALLFLGPLEGVRTGPPKGTAPGLPPVVLVVLDTVRADHLREYGYPRATMPNLSRFAREQAVVVSRAIANASWTAPSHGAMFTGLYPSRNGLYGTTLAEFASGRAGLTRLREGVPTLASILAARGWWTAAVIANYAGLHSAMGLDRGFHLYRAHRNGDDALKRYSPWVTLWVAMGRWAPHAVQSRLGLADILGRGVTYRRAASITDEALSVLARARDGGLFLFVNYLDAHHPYQPPRECDPFRARPPDAVPEGTGWVSAARRRVLGQAGGLSPREREHLVALYDGELACMDRELGRLLDGLARHPRWREAIVVVTSDHGEAFGEHDLLYHGLQLYSELLEVPLVLKLPAAPPDLAASTMQSVDVFATILEALGLPVPPGIDGMPFGRGRTHSLAWQGVDPLASTYPRFARQMRSIEDRGWKYIEDSRGRAELYDLAADPGEALNLAGRHHEQESRLQAALGPLHLARGAPVEVEVAGEALRALGYLQ